MKNVVKWKYLSENIELLLYHIRILNVKSSKGQDNIDLIVVRKIIERGKEKFTCFV